MTQREVGSACSWDLLVEAERLRRQRARRESLKVALVVFVLAAVLVACDCIVVP